MDTLVVTECETHGDTLVAPAFGPRIKRVQGEYVRVILAGACPTCDGHATQDYREGSL